MPAIRDEGKQTTGERVRDGWKSWGRDSAAYYTQSPVGMRAQLAIQDVSDTSRSSVGFSPRFPQENAPAWAKAHATGTFVGHVIQIFLTGRK